jgi:Zn finger protein HypA/HybF involved in hydrogenase expression
VGTASGLLWTPIPVRPKVTRFCGTAIAALEGKEGREHQMEAYCLKCRTKREMQNAQQVTMKNGKPATRGSCPVCRTQMYRIGKG